MLSCLRAASLLLALLGISLPAAAAEEFTWIAPEQTEGLEAVSEPPFDRWLVKPDTDFSAYDSILIEPVVFALSKDPRPDQYYVAELPESDKSSLERSLRSAFSNAFEEGVTLVETAGENTLTLQIALTDVLPNRDRRGIVIRDGRSSTGQRVVISIGRATMEVLAKAPGSGEIVAAGLDSHTGRSLEDAGLRRWHDVRDAFRRWARRFRELFEG